MRLLIGIAVLFAFPVANATVIYDFTGVVTQATPSGTDLSGVTVGSNLSGWFEYDIDAMTPVLGGDIYAFGVPDYFLQIGPRSFTPNTPAAIQYETSQQRFVDLVPNSDTPDLFWADETYWKFSGLNGAPPDLDSFNSGMIFLRLLTRGVAPVNFIGQSEIFGEFTTWERRQAVPEPSSLWLFAIGLVGIGTLRRRLRADSSLRN